MNVYVVASALNYLGMQNKKKSLQKCILSLDIDNIISYNAACFDGVVVMTLCTLLLMIRQ